MKLYIRDPNNKIESQVKSSVVTGYIPVGPTPYSWWDNLETEAMMLAEDHGTVCEQIIAEFGGQVCPDFWKMNDGEYIEFPSERHATAFLLRWA
jgi:hypothetical protein